MRYAIFLKLAASAILLTSAPAQACQLVCIIAAGNLNDAGCTAAKTGFKLVKAGMLASLPQKGPEFYGSSTYLHGGISCPDTLVTAAMTMPWIAQGYGSGWPIEAIGGSAGSPSGSYLNTQCNNRYGSGNESTVCCNM